MRQKLLLLTAIASIPLYAQDPQKWAFNFGGGPTFSLSDTSNRINTGYNFTVGGGYYFTRHLGVNVDYVFNGADLSSQVLQTTGAPGGYAHVWGFGLNPIYRFGTERKLGGYVTGGYGVYTRTANLTRPGVVPGIICDPWGFYCYSGAYYADIIYRSNSTTKGGWDIAAGLTYQLSDHMKFYTELRYYKIFTTNVRTQLLPLTFGLRW
jgi:opacity protein-like surface antigen